MKRITKDWLISRGIEYTIIDGEYFYSAIDIKNKIPNLTMDMDNVVEVPFRAIRLEHIKIMSEFDLILAKSLKQIDKTKKPGLTS